MPPGPNRLKTGSIGLASHQQTDWSGEPSVLLGYQTASLAALEEMSAGEIDADCDAISLACRAGCVVATAHEADACSPHHEVDAVSVPFDRLDQDLND